MSQLSIIQIAGLFEVADPVLHFVLLAGVILVFFEVATILGDLLGSGQHGRHR